MRRFYQIEKGWLESGPLTAHFGRGIHWGGGIFCGYRSDVGMHRGSSCGARVDGVVIEGGLWYDPYIQANRGETLFTIRTNKHFVLYLNLGPQTLLTSPQIKLKPQLRRILRILLEQDILIQMCNTQNRHNRLYFLRAAYSFVTPKVTLEYQNW